MSFRLLWVHVRCTVNSFCVSALCCHLECVFISIFQENPVPAWTKPCDHLWPQGLHASDPTGSDVSPHAFSINFSAIFWLWFFEPGVTDASCQASCSTVVSKYLISTNVTKKTPWSLENDGLVLCTCYVGKHGNHLTVKLEQSQPEVLNATSKRRFTNSLLGRPTTDRRHFLPTTSVVTGSSVARLPLKGLFLRSCHTLEAIPPPC